MDSLPSLPAEPQGKPKNTEVGRLSLLLRIFPIQEVNWGLLHCRWVLYQLSYQGPREKVYFKVLNSPPLMMFDFEVLFFFFFRLNWISVALCGLSLVVVSGGYSRCLGFSSYSTGSVVMAHGS